jgi:conjugative transfer signal peptidase TraF
MIAMPDRRSIALLMGTGMVALAASISPNPMLVWNASASAPRGLYRLIHAEKCRLGDLVLADPPRWIGNLAARRNYLPAGVPLVKRIAAVVGDRVCSDGLLVSIDGKFAVRRLAMDAQRRALPHWQGCHRLKRGEEFLLMRGVSDSFDGRYFGVTPVADNLGRLVPLWTY